MAVQKISTHKLNRFAPENRKARLVLEGHVLQANASEVKIYAINDKSATVNLQKGQIPFLPVFLKQTIDCIYIRFLTTV